MEIDDLKRTLKFECSDIFLVAADLQKFVFEQRVQMMCFYCGRYGRNWRCPPHLPSMDYKSMFSEFDHAAFVIIEMPIKEHTYDKVRMDSTVILHKVLLTAEKILYERNISMVLSFIGGGCKLCRNGCAEDKCRNPYSSRSPLEATGLNVVKTLHLHNVEIEFPPKKTLKRVGLILWDNENA